MQVERIERPTPVKVLELFGGIVDGFDFESDRVEPDVRGPGSRSARTGREDEPAMHGGDGAEFFDERFDEAIGREIAGYTHNEKRKSVPLPGRSFEVINVK